MTCPFWNRGRRLLVLGRTNPTQRKYRCIVDAETSIPADLAMTTSFSRQNPVSSRHLLTRAALSLISTRLGCLGLVDLRLTPLHRT